MKFKLLEKFKNSFFPNKVGSTEDVFGEVEETTVDDSALLLTLRLTQLFLMQPVLIKIKKSNTYYVSISPLMYLVNILISALINGVVFNAIWLLLTSPEESPTRGLLAFASYNQINKLLIGVAVIPLSVASIFSTLWGSVRMRCILNCFQDIKKINQDLNKNASGHVASKTMMYCLILFATFFPLIFAAVGTWLYGFLGLPSCAQNILTAMVVLLEIQFYLIVENMNSLFHEINIQLKEVLSQLSFHYTTRTRRSMIALQIHRLMNCFVESCKILGILSRNETFLLFCHIVIFITHVFNSLFYLLPAIVHNENDSVQLSFILYQIIECCYNLFKASFIIQPCNHTEEEVDETKHYVAELMSLLESEDDPLFETVNTFYKELMLNHYTFTAMGILDVGKHLYSTIVGLAITLIMIIQF